jgi:hypothetical protein
MKKSEKINYHNQYNNVYHEKSAHYFDGGVNSAMHRPWNNEVKMEYEQYNKEELVQWYLRRNKQSE